jgi:kynureninase
VVDAATLDRDDPLRSFRDRFLLPEGVIYLDGNSLGPVPREAPERIAAVIAQEWGVSLIRAWNEHGWIDLARRIGDKIGRLIGAEPGTTVVADSTSINIFKSLGAALALRPGRRVILSETGTFPTDLYIAQGIARLHPGYSVRVVDDPVAALDDNVAILMLTHVNYRSGAMHDMASITAAAHQAGALVLWDLSHSVGAVPLSIAADGADFVVGCGYKYLNGGPGAPAFLSVAARHWPELRFPLTGWLGHADPFAFDPSYQAAQGIAGAVVGTPPILSLAALEVGVDLMLEAPIELVQGKSLALTERFLAAIEARGFRSITPTDPGRRGSQVSFRHEDGYAIMQALIARGVIGDFRTPDVMRFGFAPLYLRHQDVDSAIAILDDVMRTQAWRDPAYQQRQAVT